MKATVSGLVLICLIISCYMSSTVTAAEDKNLVLYLTFDKDKPVDLSLKKSPIASYIKPVELVEGIKDKAWLFDESTCVLLDVQTFNDAFQESTFSVWLKEPGKDGILYEEGGGTNGYAVTLVKKEVQFATRDGGTQTTISADYPYDGNWHFITTVFDRGTMRLYIDGKLMKEKSGVRGIGGHGNEMGIGKVNGGSAGGVTPKFTGIMDEFRITRRALTIGEIQEIVKSFYAVKSLGKYHTTWGAIKLK